jgi:hypothetical protein
MPRQRGDSLSGVYSLAQLIGWSAMLYESVILTGEHTEEDGIWADSEVNT